MVLRCRQDVDCQMTQCHGGVRPPLTVPRRQPLKYQRVRTFGNINSQDEGRVRMEEAGLRQVQRQEQQTSAVFGVVGGFRRNGAP